MNEADVFNVPYSFYPTEHDLEAGRLLAEKYFASAARVLQLDNTLGQWWRVGYERVASLEERVARVNGQEEPE